MDNNSLGVVLKVRRKERELSLVALGKLTGLHSSFIARVEKGERSPSGLALRKLAKPLGFSEFELCKLAGLIPRDATDDRLDRFKKSVKKEIIETLVNLCERIEKL